MTGIITGTRSICVDKITLEQLVKVNGGIENFADLAGCDARAVFTALKDGTMASRVRNKIRKAAEDGRIKHDLVKFETGARPLRDVIPEEARLPEAKPGEQLTFMAMNEAEMEAFKEFMKAREKAK